MAVEKTKAELEKDKLTLEIRQLEAGIKQSSFQKWAAIFQTLSVMIGIGLALNEFVFKDREATNNKVKATIEYVSKIANPELRKAEDSLARYQELCETTPVADSFDFKLFGNLKTRFPKGTFALTNYYNILQSGIEQGYFDKNLSETFLSYDAQRNIDLLENIQARHHGLDTKIPIPDYRDFKGLIDFYVGSQKLEENEKETVPQYETGKPFVKPFR